MTSRARRILAALLLGSAAANAWLMYTLLAPGEFATLPLLAMVLALASPAVVAVLWFLRRPGPRSIGVVAGVAIMASVQAVSFGSLGFLGAVNPGDANQVFTMIGILLLPNAIAAVAAIVMALREFGRSALGHVAIGTGIAVFLEAGAAMAAFAASTAIDIGATLNWGSKHTQLEQVVTHVQACAMKYNEQSPEGAYPASIETLGPAGSGCLDKEWLGKAAKMNIRYVPERDAGGAVTSFAVYGRVSASGSPDIGASADTSGTMVTFTMDGPERPMLPIGPERAVGRLAWLRNCALMDKHSQGSPDLPEHMTEVLRVGAPGQMGALLDCVRFDDTVLVKEPDSFIREGHRFTYRAQRDSFGDVEHFAMEARPVTFGVTAINSYLVRDSGLVHVTHSDRAAAESDPVIPECRYVDSVATGLRRCVTLARPRLPLPVTLMHPSDVGRDERFTVYVRDAQDTSLKPDSSLWFGFYCQADSAHMAYLSLPRLSHRQQEMCSLPHLEPGKPYPVLLVVRDTLGRVGWRIDSIPIRATP